MVREELAELASLVDTWAYMNVYGEAVLTARDEDYLDELRAAYPEEYDAMYSQAQAKHQRTFDGVGRGGALITGFLAGLTPEEKGIEGILFSERFALFTEALTPDDLWCVQVCLSRLNDLVAAGMG